MDTTNYLSLCCNDQYGITADQIGLMMDKNEREVIVMTREEYIQFLQEKAGSNRELHKELWAIVSQSSFKDYWNETLSPNIGKSAVVPGALLVNDLTVISKTLYLVGPTLRYYIKGDYIVLTGHSGLRKALTGTRYLLSNPKIVEMGFGLKGLQAVAKGGFVLGMVVSTAVETLDFILNDEKTMVDLVGGIGVEAVKGGIAAFAAYALTTAVVGISTTIAGVAAAPLIGMAFVAFGVSYALNFVDDKYKIKQRVIATIKSMPDNLERGYYILKSAAEADWKAEVQREISRLGDWLVRATTQQAEEIFRRVIRDFFRHRLISIGISR